jgi:hypothetical protein
MKALNRKHLPKWTKPLTAKEIRHLQNDAGGLTLQALKNNLAHQQRGDCWECWTIGKKLNLI